MNNTVLKLVTLIFLSAFGLHAQQGWFWQNPLPVGDGLGTIEFVSATEGWISTENGQLLHTTNAGSTWNVQSPNPGVVMTIASGAGPSVSFLNASIGWVMGFLGGYDNPSGAVLYKTTNGGASWVQQNLGSESVGLAVQFVDANNGWAVTGSGTFESGSILHSTNGGTNWSSQYTSGANKLIVSISFVDANNGWAVIDSLSSEPDFVSPATIIHTTNGGATWITQLNDTTAGTLGAVQFVDANNGWVVGDSAKILHTTNGGTNWSAVTNAGISSSSKNRSLFFLDTNIGWISSGNNVLHTTNGGATWTTQSPGTQYSIFSTYFVDVNNGWVAADYGGIVHTTDGGATWSLQSSTVTNNGLYSVAALPDGNNIWAVGGDVYGGGSGTILHTANAGINWAVQSIQTNSIQSVSFTDVNTGTAVGKGATILHTTNGGSTWTSQTNPYSGTGQTFWGVSFTDANNGTVVANGGTILRTTDGGTTWLKQTSGITNALFGIHFNDANNGTIVGGSGSILHTTNGGTDWTIQTSGTSRSLWRVFFSDANTGTVAGDSGTILRTTNAGGTWTSQTSGTSNSLEGIFFSDANTGIMTGFGGIILRTTNGGATWTKQASGTTHDLWGVAFSSANVGTIVGTSGTILRTTTGGVVSSVQEYRQAEIPSHFVLEHNYPNPFNPSTTIRFSLPKSSYVTLKVYNLLGQEIEILVNGLRTAGTYKVEWNSRNLPSGVYFYGLTAGTATATSKMILLK